MTYPPHHPEQSAAEPSSPGPMHQAPPFPTDPSSGAPSAASWSPVMSAPSAPPPAPPVPPPAQAYGPPVFTPGPPATTGQRPGVAVGAVVVLIAYALFTLIEVGIQAFSILMHLSSVEPLGLKSVVWGLVIMLLAMVAAVLVAMGRDTGRALGLALAGYASLAGISGTLTTLFFAIEHASGGMLVTIAVMLLGACLGAAAFALLATRRVAEWCHQPRATAGL